MHADRPEPPVALRRPTILSAHGETRVDDWYWLRERESTEVRAYLEAENAYTDALLAPTASLRTKIFEEIKSRVQETDRSAPVPDGPWEYSVQTLEGLQYAIHARRPRGSGDDEYRVLLDENVEAEGQEYFALGVFETSPDHRLLAYAVDFTGGERYQLRFRDLDASENLGDVVDNVYYGCGWYDDCRSVLYVRPDDAMRPHQVWRHVIGTDQREDQCIFDEPDERFFVHLERTRSGRFLVVSVSSKMTSEVWFVPTDDSIAQLRLVAPREQGHEYDVEHHWHEETGDRFLIATNGGGARNFRLVAAPVDNPGRDYWRELVPHRDDVKLDAVDAFAEHLVLSERFDGLERLRVMRCEDSDIYEVPVPDPVYSAWVGPNTEFDTSVLRFQYSSLVAPLSDFDYDMETRTTTLVKRQPVPGGYDPDLFASDRCWAIAADGARVPISVVYRRDVERDGTAPMLLYGYGAYEHSVDPVFRASRLSLLDRGFVFAIAHIRGGGELGRPWYESGRLAHKANTFHDYIACAEHLAAEGYTAAGRIVARGASAGGLLMGAVANLRPDLFAAVIAEVPFVDVLTTMQDSDLPLTVTEWEEWGDPSDAEMYRVIADYSPYDNVRAQAYPSMLVTAGLNDPRVQYWEPAKWVAKLRDATTSDAPILLRTEMGAGHGGPSGRYDAWRDEALVLAFACDAVGIRD